MSSPNSPDQNNEEFKLENLFSVKGKVALVTGNSRLEPKIQPAP
jgi:hypothetical protein